MSKRSWNFMTVMLATLAVLVFAAGAPALRSTVKAQGEISGELNIMGFGMPDEIATVRVDTFKEMYPDVTVNITEARWISSSSSPPSPAGTRPIWSIWVVT